MSGAEELFGRIVLVLRHREFLFAGILLNGCIAIVMLLVWARILDIDLTRSAGFWLTLVYLFGNLAIISLALLKEGLLLDGPRPDEAFPGSSFPRGRWGVQSILGIVRNPKLTYLVLLIIPFIVFGYGLTGHIVLPKEINITVERPDASTVIVTDSGGRDAGNLLLLEADVSCTDWRSSQRSYLGSDTSLTPISVGKNITFTGPFPKGCDLVVKAHFSDGEKETFIDSPL